MKESVRLITPKFEVNYAKNYGRRIVARKDENFANS